MILPFFLQDLDSVKHTLDLCHHFHHCAGLKLNKHKTEAFQLGVVSNNIDSKYSLNLSGVLRKLK